MKLLFITEARFVKTIDGNIYSLESSFSMSLFNRYLQDFKSVIILARTMSATQNEVIDSNRLDKNKVRLVELPYYIGFSQFLISYFKLKRSITTELNKIDFRNVVTICRVPGRIGSISIDYLKKNKIPYGIEVVGDPYDVLSNGTLKYPLAPIIRYFSVRSLKKITHKAPAAIFVTKSKLQERYPCPNFSIGVSDVVMPPSAFVKSTRVLFKEKITKIVCIGSLDQMYKAPDIIIKALKILQDRRVLCQLKWIGDGKFKNDIITLVNELDLSDLVYFTGKLATGDAVRNQLDNSDLFLLVSRTEGLPRAMVEAMARALPCIGSEIGGIPELLDQQALVKVNDIVGLADKIQYFIENREFAQQQAEHNLEVAKTFAENILNTERKKFYNYLKQTVSERYN